MDVIIVAIVSYLIGSIPFAVVISRLYRLGDITKFGSGNPGATNMARFGGRNLAIITLVLDASKGAFAVWLAEFFGPNAASIAFGAVILGHCFSIFLRMRGGKGVATFIGGLLVLNPVAGAICVALWITSFLIFRISSLAALISINTTAILSIIMWHGYAYAIVLAALLITYRHKSNIKKLLEGSEK